MITNSISNLLEIKNLLSLLTVEHYTAKLSLFKGVSLGKHIRHIVEFYKSVLLSKNGVIYYDKRERNLRLEVDQFYCIEEIDGLLAKISCVRDDHEVLVITDLGEFRSSFQRELLYALEHSIHHQALIKIGLAELKLENLVTTEFGVASSTLKFQKECAR